MTPPSNKNAGEICKNCVHWVYTDDRSRWITRPLDEDTNEPMKFEFEVRKCKNPKLLFCERPVESDGFAVADGSTYYAALITAENFGCKLFEVKK